MNVVSRSSLWRLAKEEKEKANKSLASDDIEHESSFTNESNSSAQESRGESQSQPKKTISSNKNNILTQNQFDQIVQTLSSENKNVSRLERRIEKIESQLSTMVEQNSKILTTIKKIAEKFQTSLPKPEFPIKTIEELDEIEAKVAANPEKYVELFRTILSPEGVKKHLNRILATSILMNMNYSGTCSKTGLNSYVSLNMSLYESQKRDGYTFGDYGKEVRAAFAKLKNRVYKATTLSKKIRKATEN
ncbi:uncharacterized protein LOC108042639 [Drosophila rhopaloa]|uniref:Uncharacterized protein LOC108042639 n=1 Tax=Drosophila rhopaloa TaxID=1041015 RepID=A0A6P4EEF6_DRORH|nr:uncharacterized protein LOC108042639 [Drosophila rhopaloa]XP_016976528.1 uncharacterized protein LOC108042639 [Drosophila rhopaloa]